MRHIVNNKTAKNSGLSFGLKAISGVALAASLTACGGNGGSGLGYAKNPPDEFNVVRQAPLILPPDFNLRPPSAQSARPATPAGAELARLIVLPNAPQTPIPASEQSLLDKAARGGTYGNGIREELSNRASGKASEAATTVEVLTQDQSKDAQ
jgi:hypothetical protein